MLYITRTAWSLVLQNWHVELVEWEVHQPVKFGAAIEREARGVKNQQKNGTYLQETGIVPIRAA